VVVDDVVEVGVAHASVSVGVGAAEHPVTPTGWDPAQLLDVHVHQLAWAGAFVADRAGSANHQTGGLV
jgi:hypothetical protein